MNSIVTLDGAKLKEIGHASHTAEVTMTALAMRERLRHFSDITRTKNQLIRNGEKIVDADYMAFWKALQDAGVGVIIFGRRGKPDRFEWHYSLKSVAKASLEGKNEQAEKITKGKKVKSQPKEFKTEAKVKSAASSEGRTVYIPLRPDFDVEIPVPPKGFSSDEVKVINRALRRLSG